MENWPNIMPCIHLSNVTSDFPKGIFFADSLMTFVFAHSLAVYLSNLGWLLHQWLHPAVL